MMVDLLVKQTNVRVRVFEHVGSFGFGCLERRCDVSIGRRIDRCLRQWYLPRTKGRHTHDHVSYTLSPQKRGNDGLASKT